MLRDVTNLHIRPRIVPFQLTTAATPSCTVNIGYGSITATRSGTAGAGTITPRTPFARGGMLFMGQTSTTGGYATYNTTTASSSAFAYSMLAAGGAATDGAGDGFLLGWGSSDVNLTAKQDVVCTFNYPKMIYGKVTGATGAVAIGRGDFTCTRTGTGVYNVGYAVCFGTTPVVIVTGIAGAAASTGKVTAKTASGCTVTMATQAAVADQDFYIVVIGQRSRSDAGRLRSVITTTQRKTRIVAATITNTGGTWSWTNGLPDFSSTITDTGAGDFSLTLSKPFAREPIVIATTTTQRAQCGAAAATNLVRIQTRAAGGAATDTNGITNVFIIGSDDLTEY
jgi:hypothetical protein